jgi:hypothetical protein
LLFGAVLPRHLRARDVDHLETLQVELAHEVLEPAPVAISALEDDTAALQQSLEHQLDVETAFLVLLGSEREILEVDEHRGRHLDP